MNFLSSYVPLGYSVDMSYHAIQLLLEVHQLVSFLDEVTQDLLLSAYYTIEG